MEKNISELSKIKLILEQLYHEQSPKSPELKEVIDMLDELLKRESNISEILFKDIVQTILRGLIGGEIAEWYEMIFRE
jgi:hypothetical protein